MMLPDGREVLVRFATPLAVNLVAEICDAVRLAAARLGYTDVDMSGGDDTPCIIATPPARPRLVAAERRVTR